MKLIIAQNYSNRKYEVIGVSYGVTFKAEFTLAELLSNHTDTDTELLYTLQESIDRVIDLKINDTLVTKSSRDEKENNIAIVIRLT
jgi:hypothetical protein